MTGVSRLSGNSVFAVSGSQINNSSTAPNSSCAAANAAACGSVRIQGQAITRVYLQAFLRSPQTTAWPSNGAEGWLLGVSGEVSDMTPALSGLPATIVPGTTYNATLTCTNLGPNTARGAFCTPSANVGTVSNISCTPAIPADIGPTGPNNTAVCTFDYALPVGGTQTQVVFTGQTGATNDRNGGAVGTAGNNQTQATRPVRAPRLTVTKVLNGTPGRDQSTDQFTLTISGTGGPVSTTTGGTGTTVSNGSATLATATAGQGYTFTETFAGTSSAANYNTAYSCANALSGGTSIPSGSATSFTTPALVSGDDITCTFTNTFRNEADLVTAKTLNSAASDVNNGETVSFLITVTNNGPAVARNVTLTDSLPAGLTATGGNGVASAGSYDAGTGVWSIPSLASGVSATLVLEGTVDAGQGGQTITNTTTAATGDQTDPTTGGDDLTESVTVIPNPALSLLKTGSFVDANGNGRADAGETVTYAFTVANTGNVPLTGVTISDTIASVTGGPVTLAVGASDATTFTASYTLDQDDIDAGEVQNTATATGTPPTGADVTDASHPTDPAADDPTVTPLPQAPALALVKSAALNDADASGAIEPGDTVTYTYTVTNTGNTTLYNPAVTEQAGGFTGAGVLPVPAYAAGGGDYDAGVGTADLRPTESMTFTATYTLTQDDVDAGGITNQALASATDPDGDPITDLSDETGTTAADNDPTVTTIPQEPRLAAVKTGSYTDVNGDGITNPGDRIDYVYEVTNTGTVTVYNVSVAETGFTGTGTAPVPAYASDGADLDSGAGSFDLSPGASLTFEAAYIITQADIDAGSVANQALASASDPNGDPVTDPTDDSSTDPGEDDATVTPMTTAPRLAMVKTAVYSDTNGSGRTDAGDTLSYTYTITNTGNVTLFDVAATENPAPEFTGAGTLPAPAYASGGADLDGEADATDLSPGAAATFTADYILVQADIDRGNVQNRATGAGTDPAGTPVSDLSDNSSTAPGQDDPTVTPLPQVASLAMEKSTTQTDPSEFFVGNTITYSYLVTNTGTVTLADPVTVTDDRIDAADISCPSAPGGLAPNASLPCTGTYQITANDTAFGSVTNIAQAVSGGVTSPVSSVSIPAGAVPALTIEKSVQSVSSGAATFAAVGETITYEYLVTNAGDAALASDVTIFDDVISPILGGNFLCRDHAANGDFNPGDTFTCTATYDVIQADLDRGHVINFATANAVFAPTGANIPVQSTADDARVDAAVDPALTLAKTASPATGAAVGQTITYTLTATNTGNQTLSGVEISDPLLSGVTCSVAAPVTLAPTQALVCTGSYVVTQADVDAGQVVNPATATAVSPQNAPVPASTSLTTPTVPADPELTLTKVSGGFNDANGNGQPDAGETITYSFTLENTGNVTLSDVTLTDDALTPSLIGTVSSLAPGDSRGYSRSYTITQADLDSANADLENTANATSQDPAGNPVPATSVVTTPLPRAPSLNLIKTSSVEDTNATGVTDAGDTIRYAFAVTNTGNVTINDIQLTDDLPEAVITAAGPIASLAPGQTDTTSFAAEVVITQAHIDAGGVENHATATGTDNTGAPVSDLSDDPANPADVDADGDGNPDDPTFTALAPVPGIAVIKTVDASGLQSPPQAGDVLTYAFTVRNTGNITLTDVTITDSEPGVVLTGGPIASLAPGEEVGNVYVATRAITTDDIIAGIADNQATATGTYTSGSQPPLTVSDLSGTTFAEDAPTEVALAQVSGIAVTKVAITTALTIPAQIGQTLDYTFTVTNTGNIPILGYTFADAALGISVYRADALGAGKSATFTASGIASAYAITQADIDRGVFENQASVVAAPISGFPASTDLSDDPADPTDADANGDGNPDDPTVVSIGQNPELRLVKTGSFTDLNGNGRPDPGDRITYAFAVTNTGNVTIEDLTITDPLPGVVLAGGPLATLSPGETDTSTFTGYLVLTQSHINAGQVANRATASGLDPNGDPVTDASHLTSATPSDQADTVVALEQIPRLALVKTGIFTDAGGDPGDAGNGQADPDEIVTYAFTVTNTGNVPMTAITVDDTGLPGVIVAGGPIDLAPGQSNSTAFTASYAITQADIDAGNVDNIAGVTGTDVNSAPFTDLSHPTSAVPGATAPTPVALPQVPGLSVVKSAPSGAPIYSAGQVVTYEFVVTNTGNTSITGPITVSDNRIGAISCGNLPNGGLPGEQLICNAAYTLTANDVALGSVTNNARATDGLVQSPSDNETVPSGVDPALTIGKEILSVNGALGTTQFTTAGDVIRYRYTVTNSGGAAFASDVYVTDDVISPGAGDILCWDHAVLGDFNPATQDDPASVAVCEADYTVTQADLDRTFVTNEAFASSIFAPASPDPLDVQSPTDAETATSIIDRDITLTKTASPASGAVPGDTITYTLVAVNSGNQTLYNVTVSDPMLTGLTCDTPAPVTLSPLSQITCTGTYQVTQQDIDNEVIGNLARVTATSPQGTAVSDEAAVDHIPQAPNPALTLTKTASAYADANGNGRPDAGEVITYGFTVTNSGNQTLTDVVVDDVNLTPSLIDTIASMMPGDVRTYSRSYALTQADLDAQTPSKDNTATAAGTDPDLQPVTAQDTATTALSRAPGLTLDKQATFVEVTIPGMQNAGDRIDYTITVTNTGNVTVSDISIIDTQISATPLALGVTLAPGASQQVTGSYVLQVSDINAGSVVNTATSAGEAWNGTALQPVEAEDSVTVPLLAAPGLETVKTAAVTDADGSGRTDAGDLIDYEITVTNTGNVTLDGLSLNDTLSRLGGGGLTLDTGPSFVLSSLGSAEGVLLPGETARYTASYMLVQADVDAGGVSNTVTAWAEDPAGTPVSDVSDDGDDTDGNTADDPTVTVVAPLPGLALQKTATVIDSNGSGRTDAGDRVSYAFRVENTGNVTLDQVTVDDLLPGIALSGGPLDDFAPGDVDSTTFTATYTLQLSDLNVGQVTNSATVSAQPPVGPVVSDVSDDPANPADVDPDSDGNPDDPTVTPLARDGRLALVKIGTFVDTDGNNQANVGDRIDYRFEVTNTGNVTLYDMVLAEDLAVFTGTGTLEPASYLSGGGDYDGNGAGSPDLAPAEVMVFGLSYFLTDDDAQAGSVTNQAIASGTRPDGTTASDRSDDSETADGAEDPTAVRLNRPPVAADDLLSGLAMTQPVTLDPLANDADPDGALDPATVVFTDPSASDGGKTLAVAGEGTWSIDPLSGAVTFTPEAGFTANPTPVAYVVSDLDGSVSNEAQITLLFAVDPPVAADDAQSDIEIGQAVTIDVLANDSDPDGALDATSVRIVGAGGNGTRLVVAGEGVWTVDAVSGAISFVPAEGFTGDPTPIRYTVADNDGNISNEATVTLDYRGVPELALAVEVATIRDTNGNGITDPGDVIVWRFIVTNIGNVDLSGVDLTEWSLPMPGLSCAPVDLAVGASAVLECRNAEYVITEQDAERGAIALAASAAGVDGGGVVATASNAAVTVPLVAGGLEIEKTAGMGNVRVGDLVPYTITLTNLSPTMPVTTDLSDIMPSGFIYKKGTGRVGGVAQDPVVNGRRHVFADVLVPAGGKVRVRLQAFVTTAAQPGENTNTARALNPFTGQPISPTATATVLLDADPVFDCGTVIGRVFDDVNQDGYMNGPSTVRGLTNQDYVPDGKVGRSPEPATVSGGEQGLAGVRLVTVRGTIITTDKHGRFHVPCADLPRDIGSNFLLKLDERTLPTGYRMTTENPRVVRLTAGKMTEMNFGAAISRVVRIDLSDRAFLEGKDAAKPRPELEQGLRQMVGQIASTPSVLRFNYVLGPDGERLAKARLREVERIVRHLWRGTGRYKLNVETLIERVPARSGTE